jgi:hypothetical protein
MAESAGGTVRWVEVDPGRLARWLDGFAERHGGAAVTPQEYGIRLVGADGAVAECHAPPGAPPAADRAPAGPAERGGDGRRRG